MVGEPASIWIPIGRVRTTHGVRGALKLEIFGESDWPGLSKVWLRAEPEAAPRCFPVTQVRDAPEAFLVSLEGLQSKEAAAAFRGWEVVMAAEDLPPLGEGEFYQHELVGMKLVRSDGRLLGQVKGFRSAGPRLLAEVLGSKGASFLMPIEDGWVRRMDRAKGELVIDPPEGIDAL